MRVEIIETYDSKKHGNECMIYTDMALEKIGYYYVVVYIQRMVGWFGVKYNTILETFDYIEDARKYFNEKKDK